MLSDQAFIKKIQKKTECKIDGCGTNFVFKVMPAATPDKEVYNGYCTECHISLKLDTEDFTRFCRLIGKPKLERYKSNFDELFEEK